MDRDLYQEKTKLAVTETKKTLYEGGAKWAKENNREPIVLDQKTNPSVYSVVGGEARGKK